MSEKITVDTSSNSISNNNNNKTAAIFSGDSDRGEARVTMEMHR